MNMLCFSMPYKSLLDIRYIYDIPIRYKFGHSGPCCVYAIFLLAGLSPHSTDF